jgi:hypothetical protein
MSMRRPIAYDSGLYRQLKRVRACTPDRSLDCRPKNCQKREEWDSLTKGGVRCAQLYTDKSVRDIRKDTVGPERTQILPFETAESSSPSTTLARECLINLSRVPKPFTLSEAALAFSRGGAATGWPFRRDRAVCLLQSDAAMDAGL